MVGKKSPESQKSFQAQVHSPYATPDVVDPESTGATVIRFHRKAGAKGVSKLEDFGFKVAAASDFNSQENVPPDFDGADIQYFERFGIAIVQNDPERLQSAMSTLASNAVANTRPERVFHALGFSNSAEVENNAPQTQNRFSRDYLTGYRDGVTQVIDHLLGGAPEGQLLGTQSAETEATWGLQATKTLVSRCTGLGIRVAVLDTGFDLGHPDFSGRRVIAKSFISNEEVQDHNGHGTHCIGTACGPLRPTGQPRYGIAYEADIHAGKVLSNAGRGTDRSIIAGIDWALDQKCAVISMSLGASVRPGDNFIEDYEIIAQTALSEDALIVAAAGNESHRPGYIAPVGSPANCPSILAVGAVDRSMQIASFSCGGVNHRQAVDLVAPGVDVLSSYPGGHRRLNGTSMATPHVAGIAALFAQSDEKYRGLALWSVLLQHCRSLGLSDRDVGKGLAQAPY